MIRFSSIFLGISLGALIVSAQDPEAWKARLKTLPPEEAGRVLAARLLSATPVENMTYEGVLKVRPSGGVMREVPFVCQVRVQPQSWQVTYETAPVPGTPSERLTVVHAADGAIRYFFERAGTDAAAGSARRELTPRELNLPLAGTDFWAIDLGLDFLRWPTQKLLKVQMRKGRSCWVLESINPDPQPTTYHRVVSWVDLEAEAIILAEAYDAQDRRLKEFSIKSLRKVQGEWRLSEMHIRNAQTRSRTWIEFDYDTK